MDDPESVPRKMWKHVPPAWRDTLTQQLAQWPVEQWLARVPGVKKEMDQEFQSILAKLKPAGSLQGFQQELPLTGRSADEVLNTLRQYAEHETAHWAQGKVSGTVYHGQEAHRRLMEEVYTLYSQANPLHTDVWPSLVHLENEVISMVAHMLGQATSSDELCGTITSGGTESILLAVKSYRDQAAARGIRHPELMVPRSALVAFDKACSYVRINKREITTDEPSRRDVKPVSQALSKNTIAIIGSAPSFPHGVIDPIAELSEIALKAGIGLHVDACLGGFILPWVKDLYKLPPFDFSLPGVTSMSVDTHKYGYASKGSSVILYRHVEQRRAQFYVAADWPGGLYASPTLAGSRPGATIAQCWASMVSIGEAGYREHAQNIVATTRFIQDGIRRTMPDIELVAESLFMVSVRSRTLNIFSILEKMSQKGWSLNGLQKPNSFHLCVTLMHTQSGIAEQFLTDLRESVDAVRRAPHVEEGMAPIYGMASSLPVRGMVQELLRRYLDRLYSR
jgi:sphinganine-1-phosphate aldolase